MSRRVDMNRERDGEDAKGETEGKLDKARDRRQAAACRASRERWHASQTLRLPAARTDLLLH